MKYYSQMDRFEYKQPSYELITDREPSQDTLKFHRMKRRFVYDNEEKCYISSNAKKDRVTMIVAGDLLCLEKMYTAHKLKQGGFDFSLCFDYISPIIQSADIAIGNLETPISQSAPHRGEILTHDGPYYCNAPTEFLDALSETGFDILTTANNHTIDAGVRGLLETADLLDEYGFIRTGTFRDELEDRFVIVDICGFKVGFTAFSVGYNHMDKNLTDEGKRVLLNTYSKKSAKRILNEMKKRGAEYTVCFPHWGKEYTEKIHPKQRDIAEQLTSMGYDILLGAHSHVVQKYQKVNGKPIVFSMGNLISHLNTKNEADAEYTVLVKLVLERTADGIAATPEVIPCKILKNYNGIPYTVIPLLREIGLSEETEPKLKGISAVIKRRMGDIRICDNMLISESARTAFEKKQLSIPKKIQMLTDERFPTYKTVEEEYKEEHDGVVLTELHSRNATIKICDSRKGKPITKFYNKSAGNNTTRVVYLGQYIEEIGADAFRNFTALESVRIFRFMLTIGESAFEGCTSLTGIAIPSGVRKIGARAFAECSAMLSIKLPKSVKTIGKDAFDGCSKLTVYCEKGSYAERYAILNGIPVIYMPLGPFSSRRRNSGKPKASRARMIAKGNSHNTAELKGFPRIRRIYRMTRRKALKIASRILKI